jgi:hypothetical protein
MYSLKREAIGARLYPRRFPIPILAQEFCKMVSKSGRNSEFWLVLRMALRSNPLILFRLIPTGWQMVRAGRLSLRRERVRDLSTLPKQIAPREVA